MNSAQRASLALVGASLLFISSDSAAQAVSQSPVAVSNCVESDEAASTYDLGKDLLNKNLNRAALDAFRHSYEVSHCVRSLAQMAAAEKGLRRWADAAAHLRVALESDDPWMVARRDPYQKELQLIEERLRQASGHNEDPEQSSAPAKSSPRSTAGWMLMLAGALSAGTGIGTLALAEAFRSPFNAAKTQDPSLQPPWDQAGNIQQSAQVAGIAVLAVGGASLAAGITLLLLPKKESGVRTASALRPDTSSGLTQQWSR